MTEAGDAAQLDEASEREWALLHDQFDLAEGFWLGFIFSPTYTAPRVWAERVERKVRAAERTLRRWQVKTAAALPEVLLEVVAAAREGTADCLWVEALENDLGDTPPELSWTASWSELLMRLNERREVFVRHHQGALLVVAPPWVKLVVWERAPDLWAYRSIVVELRLEAPPWRPVLTPESLLVIDGAPLSAEEEGALTAAERTLAGATRLTQAIEVVHVAEMVGKRGRWDKARELLTWVLALPRDPQTPPGVVALCLIFLARAELALGDHPAAAEHLERAQAMDQELDDADVWWGCDRLARLRYSAQDLPGAFEAGQRALEIARRAASRHPGAEEYNRLFISLGMESGQRFLMEDPVGGESARRESVALVRHIIEKFGETSRALRVLHDSLKDLGIFQEQRGDFAAALELYTEALILARVLLLREGESRESLTTLMHTLTQLSGAYRECGRESEAPHIVEELLFLGKRLSSGMSIAS